MLAVYGKEIVSLLVPIVTWALKRFFSPKVELQGSNPHAFYFTVNEPLRDAEGKEIRPTQLVHTRSLLVRNAGKRIATRVECVFRHKPFCLNVWPARNYFERATPEGAYSYMFPSLGPGEHVGFEVFAINTPVPDLVTIRCDQTGKAKWVDMTPQPVAPPWLVKLMVVSSLAGLGLAVYLLLLLLQIILGSR